MLAAGKAATKNEWKLKKEKHRDVSVVKTTERNLMPFTRSRRRCGQYGSLVGIPVLYETM